MKQYILESGTAIAGVMKDDSGFITSDIESIAEVLWINHQSIRHMKILVEAILEADQEFLWLDNQWKYELPKNLTFISNIQAGWIIDTIKIKNDLSINVVKNHGDTCLTVNQINS